MAEVIVTAVVVAVATATIATTVTAGTAVACEKQRRKKTTEDIETSTVAGRRRNTGIGILPSTATIRRRNTATDTQPNTATIRRRNWATGTQPNATASSKCSSSNYRYTESGGLVCDMECMIIGSFGDELPSGVEVVRKASTKGGSFLPGVRKDLRKIQSLIRNDPTKTLTYVHTDFPGKGCLRPKEEYLQDIEDFLQGCKTPGAMIWYTGHGERGTGNWCFKDGVITFEEVFALYQKHFQGKLLYLICDCCFSGNWIWRCAETLDSMHNIRPCGHHAREQGILMKIGTACLPDQIAYDTYYSSNGVAPASDGSGVMSFWAKKEIGSTEKRQTALFMDFTEVHCFSIPEESCRLGRIPSSVIWSWKDITDRKDSFVERFRIVRGTEQKGRIWHLVIVFYHQLEEFIALTDGTRTINTTNYGHIVFSGWGQDPPAETEKLWTLYGPT